MVTALLSVTGGREGDFIDTGGAPHLEGRTLSPQLSTFDPILPQSSIGPDREWFGGIKSLKVGILYPSMMTLPTTPAYPNSEMILIPRATPTPYTGPQLRGGLVIPSTDPGP